MSDDVQQKVTYSVGDNGDIHREQGPDKLRVGNYNAASQTLALVEQYRNYRVAISRHLNANDMPASTVVMEGDTPDPVDKAQEVAGASVVAETIPPRPKKHPAYGDKTPAVVEWYEKYKPAEFRAKYGVKGPKMDNGKWPAERQTHRTEKVPEHEIEGDADWDVDVSEIEGGNQ